MIKKNILSLGLAAAGLLALPLASQAQTKIYIDPGHGGSDPGAVNSTFGTEEADRVLYTGLELRDYLNDDTSDTGGGGSWSVRMSRSTDVFVSLGGRSADANSWGAARFLSIHQNAFNSSANGTETFSFSNGTTSANLRDRVQEEAIQAWGLVNRGSKTANFSVLRNTNMPAILTEMGFIDSPTDHPFCSSNVECSEYALGMLYGIQRHYGIAEYEPGGSPPPPPPGTIVDNGGSGYSESGTWGTSSSSGFYGSSSRWALVFNQPNNEATFAPNLSQSGQYEVYVWWVAGSNRSSGARLEINHLEGQSVYTANQEQNGGQWVLAGTYNFAAGTGGNVKWTSDGSLNDGSSGTVISSDAARFVRIGDVVIQDVVTDNSDPGFSASSNWFPSTSVSGYLGSNYHARAAEATGDAAGYTQTLPVAGSYEVWARWTAAGNRATATPYIVYHNGGSTTIFANQQQNNGAWMSLGTYNFNAGSAQRVLISCWTGSGSFVIADGIRFEKQ